MTKLDAKLNDPLVVEFQNNRRAVGMNGGKFGAFLELIEDELVKLRVSFFAKKRRSKNEEDLCNLLRVSFLSTQARMLWQLQPASPKDIADLTACDLLIDLLGEDGVQVEIQFVDDQAARCKYICKSQGCVDFQMEEGVFVDIQSLQSNFNIQAK